jgi:hypothetical protein
MTNKRGCRGNFSKMKKSILSLLYDAKGKVAKQPKSSEFHLKLYV